MLPTLLIHLKPGWVCCLGFVISVQRHTVMHLWHPDLRCEGCLHCQAS